jgi:expansin
MNIHSYYIVAAALVATVTVSAQPDQGTIVHSGQATYYAATGGGNCSFAESPNDLMVCAMNEFEYDTASVCGASIHVKGPKGEVTVRIVDQCPGCPRGNVDLSKQAFMKIADTIQGRVAITWSYVETAVTGPVQYEIVTGSSQWWIGVMVLNHRNPVVQLEAMKNGVWKILPRREWNVFIDSTGLGVGPYSFRVTDLYGEQLIDANIKLKTDSVMNGAANFASHSAVIRPVVYHGAPRGAHTAATVVLGTAAVPALKPGVACTVYDLRGRFLTALYGSSSTRPARNARLPRSGIVILSVNSPH